MIDRWIPASPRLPALLFVSLLGCGGKVVVDAASAGAGGAGGAGGSSTGSDCFTPACGRSPAVDSQCAGPGLVAFYCNAISVVPSICTLVAPDCLNCIDWCCPENIAGEPTYGPKAVDVPSGAPPEGCVERPNWGWICEAQSKPPRAVSCDGPPDYLATGCVDSSYPEDVCAPLPFYCCP